jgi:hypothetical protein
MQPQIVEQALPPKPDRSEHRTLEIKRIAGLSNPNASVIAFQNKTKILSKF